MNSLKEIMLFGTLAFWKNFNIYKIKKYYKKNESLHKIKKLRIGII